MIFQIIIDYIFSIARTVIDYIIDMTPITVGNDIINFIVEIFTYANVLFPFNKLLPLGAIYALWFSIRLGLTVFGFIKKYIPIA